MSRFHRLMLNLPDSYEPPTPYSDVEGSRFRNQRGAYAQGAAPAENGDRWPDFPTTSDDDNRD